MSLCDAWNRMTAVMREQDGELSALETLSHMPTCGRDSATNTNPGQNVTADSTYSMDWQVLRKTETHHTCCGPSVTTSTYVWGLSYVNDLVAKDAGGSRTFVQQDVNHNVMALVNTSGSVTLRFIYDTYGAGTVLTANWGSSASPVFEYGFQGGRLDAISLLYNVQRRDYSVSLGRWFQVDPWGYVDGMNLYECVGTNPVN